MNLQDTIDSYLADVADSRSTNTHAAYRGAMRSFLSTIIAHKAQSETPGLEWVGWFIKDIRALAPATEALYLTAVIGFYEWLVSDAGLGLDINMSAVRALVKRRKRKQHPAPPPFPREAVEKVIQVASELVQTNQNAPGAVLRALRDKALVLVLADTGLRVSEACNMVRGHIDWREQKATLQIKGGRQEIVRFSRRSLSAVKKYLDARASLDGKQPKGLKSCPIFARHDRGAGQKVLRLSPMGAERIVADLVTAAGLAKGTLTPHSFRHYFVTIVMRASGGNLKLAQELARHKNIAITQRYAHLSNDDLDQDYAGIFDS